MVLVISSVWCQLGVWKAERGQPARTGSLLELGKWGMREWYVVTYMWGAVFIAGQVYEYANLVSENVTLSSDRWGSVFFMATGFHGLHVTGGLLAFLLIIGRTLHHPPLHAHAGRRRGRHLVLLALRRRRVDRAVLRHLPVAMTRRVGSGLKPTSDTDDRTAP